MRPAALRPLRLAGRLAIAAILVLWPLHALQRFVVEPMLPAARAAMGLLDDRFTVTRATVIQDAGEDQLLMGVNLSGPLTVSGKTVYPFGWPLPPWGGFMPSGEWVSDGGRVAQGAYQVHYPLSAMLTSGALSLILILAWPATGAGEMIIRVLAASAFWMLFLPVDISSFALAVLWDTLHERLGEPGAANGWLVWRRFLVDGGGVALGVFVAAIAIIVSGKLSRNGWVHAGGARAP